MKKLIIIIAVSSLFLFQAHAQVTFGIQGGFGLSRQNFKILDGSMTAIGVTPFDPPKKIIAVPILTAILDIPLNQNFSIRTGLGYRQQGYSYAFEQALIIFFHIGSYSNTTLAARLNYLEMPINLSMKLPIFNRKIEALAGFTVGYCLGGKGKLQNHSHSTGYYDVPFVTPKDRNTEEYVDIDTGPNYHPYSSMELKNMSDLKYYVSQYNFNLNLGLGYEISNHVKVNGTVNYGLTNMSPSSYSQGYIIDWYGGYSFNTWVTGSRVTVIKSLSFSFTLTYMFGKKTK